MALKRNDFKMIRQGFTALLKIIASHKNTT